MIVIVREPGQHGEVIAEYDVGDVASPGDALFKAEAIRVQRVTEERIKREGPGYRSR